MAMDEHELQDTLDELREIRGRNTELVSLYIPADYDLHKIVDFLTSEQSEAENIKSKNTRKNVQSALDKIQRRLKDAGELPDKGIALFAGNVSEQEGRPDIQLWEIEPPEPIESRLYRCDKEFVLEPLEDILIETDVYGVICLDKSEAAIGYVRGNTLSVEYTMESNVPGKTTKGGQCLKSNTKIPLPDGTIQNISEMDERHKEVLSAAFDENQVTGREHNSVFTSEHDDYYTVTTRHPQRQIQATGNHRVFVFTSDGPAEKYVEELEEGELLLGTRTFDITGEEQSLDIDVPYRLSLNPDGAERLRDRRKEVGKTQSQLADEIGVSQTAISKFECGDRNPSRSTLLELMQALDIDTGRLDEYCRKQKHFVFPDSLTPELARFIGYFQGDGSVDGNRIEFYEERKSVAEQYSQLVQQLFDLEPAVKYREEKGYYRVRVYSATLVERLSGWLPAVFDHDQPTSIPTPIQKSPDQAVAAYIQGLFDAEGSVSSDEVSLSMTDEALVRELDLLLQRFGVVASLSSNMVDIQHLEGSKDVSEQYRLRISERGSLERFKEAIGFTAEDKQSALSDLIQQRTCRSRSDTIPVNGSTIRSIAENLGLTTQAFPRFNPYFRGEKHISYNRFRRGILPVLEERIQELGDDADPAATMAVDHLRSMVDGDLLLLPVDAVERTSLDRREEFYDIEVPEMENFIADGIVVHNSQQRFERIRENMYDTFLTDIAEKAKQAFLQKARDDELLGLIVGGPGFAKEDLIEKDYLPETLVDEVIAKMGTNYSGEEGLEELLDNSEDIISEAKRSKERKAVKRFLKNLKKDNGLSVYGLEDVAQALKMGAVELLLFSEDFEKYECTFDCPECDHREVKHLDEFEAENEDHSCPECGANMDLEEKEDVISMFKTKATQMDSDLMLISREHEEGERLWNMGGVAAILRYRIS